MCPVAPTKKRTDRQIDRYVNKKIHTKSCFFTHAQVRNGRIDSNQILRINSLGGRSNIFDMTSKLVEGFRRGGGAKMGLSH